MTIERLRIKFLGIEPTLPNYVYMVIVLTSVFTISLGVGNADVDMILMGGCVFTTSITAAKLNYVDVEHSACIAASGLMFLLAALVSEVLEPLGTLPY